MTRYGALIDWFTDTRTHAQWRGYRLPLPESHLRNRVGARLRAMRERREGRR